MEKSGYHYNIFDKHYYPTKSFALKLADLISTAVRYAFGGRTISAKNSYEPSKAFSIFCAVISIVVFPIGIAGLAALLVKKYGDDEGEWSRSAIKAADIASSVFPGKTASPTSSVQTKIQAITLGDKSYDIIGSVDKPTVVFQSGSGFRLSQQLVNSLPQGYSFLFLFGSSRLQTTALDSTILALLKAKYPEQKVALIFGFPANPTVSSAQGTELTADKSVKILSLWGQPENNESYYLDTGIKTYDAAFKENRYPTMFIETPTKDYTAEAAIVAKANKESIERFKTQWG